MEEVTSRVDASVQRTNPSLDDGVVPPSSFLPVHEVRLAQQPSKPVEHQPQPPSAPLPNPNQSRHQSKGANVGRPAIEMVHKKSGPNLLVRAIWYIFVGSWLGALTLAAAHIATLSIVGFPVGFWLYNRVPTVATLRPRTQELNVRSVDGVTFVETSNQAQLPLWQRLIYFILVGWWLSTIWYALALVIAVGVITLPISVIMLDRIGGIATLHKH